MNKLIIVIMISMIMASCSTQKTAIKENTPTNNLSEEDIFNITAQPKDFPLVFRRTTLIVRDIETSLSLYRDMLGMEIIYDNQLTRPNDLGEGTQQLRLVFLKATHKFYGVLGLLEYHYGEEIEEKPIAYEGFSAQNVVLLFNSQNVKEKFPMIKGMEGIKILTEPKIVEYPSPTPGKKVKVLVSTFYDPDGFLVEFNELMDEL